MDFENFKEIIVYYFEKRGWSFRKYDDKNCYLEKNYSPIEQNKIKRDFLINDEKFYSILSTEISNFGIPYYVCNSLDNKNNDTNFIVAGFQTINDFLSKSTKNYKCKWCSFQPVIRLKDKDICGLKEGYFTSFINVCEISIDTTFLEYIEDLDNWISVLSKCSLHTSGLQIKLKNRTNINNGVGVKFIYKGIELGDANLYLYEFEGVKMMVSDIGFGYERILWAINNGKNFYAPFVFKYDYLIGDLREIDRIKTVTLMVMSSIVPRSNGKGKYVRSLISELNIYTNYEKMDKYVEKYYNFYSRFIVPSLCLNEVKKIIEKEINYNIKKNILNKHCIKNYSTLLDDDVEKLCENVFIKKLELSKNKEGKIK